ncbi:MAG TPA: methyltransferase domain-containing protein [Candidatus Marinimicrobia bacterium]|nr:methyltransferase domain-containing protein [Candidatus Neomarinimicrobiota bacterium]
MDLFTMIGRNMEKDFAKIHIPLKKDIQNIIEQEFMEAGLIQALEVNDHEILIWEAWEKSDEVLELLKNRFPDDNIICEFVPDQDWNLTWIEGFQPLKIKQLWVSPPWHRDKVPSNEPVIWINPGSAFGTGTHESTRLSLYLMEKYLYPGEKILDLGCGSGILSIAASILGAGSVHAFDIDPQIEDNIRENLQLNNNPFVSWEIRDVLNLDDYACDLALINIQKPVIYPLLDKLTTLLQNKKPLNLILAGLLVTDEQELETKLNQAGYIILSKKTEGEWLSVYAESKG